jgi:hypothetical protein
VPPAAVDEGFLGCEEVDGVVVPELRVGERGAEDCGVGSMLAWATV